MITKKLKYIIRKMPFPELHDPVIILGCGRSGTTIFGKTLGHHHDVFFSNEPRSLWQSVYPETDIWSPHHEEREGRINLSAHDTDTFRNREIRRLFKIMALRNRVSAIIEKVPIRSFRLGFINAIFPEAKYIHIFRNGLEVARSIENAHQTGGWFGPNSNNFKWRELARMAREGGNGTADLPEKCSTAFEKGLLEWRLSTQSVVQFLSGLPKYRYLEISYRLFVDDPVNEAQRTLSFMEQNLDDEVKAFAQEHVRRRTTEIDIENASDLEREIGGNLLPKSVRNTTLV